MPFKNLFSKTIIQTQEIRWFDEPIIDEPPRNWFRFWSWDDHRLAYSICGISEDNQ